MGLNDLNPIGNSVETDPNHYSVIFDSSLGEMRAAIWKGKNPWALLVDTTTGKIYVGDHHNSMQERHNIPIESLYEGFFKVDTDFRDVQLGYLAEWRERQHPKAVKNGNLKNAIETALKRDFAMQGI